LRPRFASEGICIVRWADCTDDERAELSEMFADRVFPVLTPLAVDPAHPFPYISGLSLNVAVVVRDPEDAREQFARVKVPPSLPRFVRVASARFVPIEDVITAHLPTLFTGMDVQETHTFRVTRNEDVEVDEDDVENLVVALEKELTRRRFGAPVRLEVEDTMSERVLRLLVRELGVSTDEVYRLPAPLDLSGLATIADLDRPALRYPVHVPVTPRRLMVDAATPASVFATLRGGDLLVHHPYESFATTVQAFIEEAAADPDVLAIKQTLYRTSGDSPIVEALIDAAEAGKQVLAVIEIKARFDEQANIRWARALEQAGCHVVYGIVGYKTHAKLSLVVRRESDGSLKRYAHVGTGNYNPKTARVYEDLGVLTADPVVGEDLAHLFNHLSGYTRHPEYQRLLVAPDELRRGLLDRIDAEIAHHRAGRPAGIRWKVNSLVDEQVVDALYLAARAGVAVDLVVRGMCALRPGCAGLSETVTVRSIVGRFLEHSRVFHFVAGGAHDVWIGSADVMHRNLDRRVEVLLRVTDEAANARLRALLDEALSPRIACWILNADGTYERRRPGGGVVDWQAALIDRAAAGGVDKAEVW
jgi:polyphosphate kinase